MWTIFNYQINFSQGASLSQTALTPFRLRVVPLFEELKKSVNNEN